MDDPLGQAMVMGLLGGIAAVITGGVKMTKSVKIRTLFNLADHSIFSRKQHIAISLTVSSIITFVSAPLLNSLYHNKETFLFILFAVVPTIAAIMLLITQRFKLAALATALALVASICYGEEIFDTSWGYLFSMLTFANLLNIAFFLAPNLSAEHQPSPKPETAE